VVAATLERSIVTRGRDLSAAAVFTAMDGLAALRLRTARLWADVDALVLPVTPGHPTLDEVAADPVGINTRLGTFTNFVNLLDLAARWCGEPERLAPVPAGSMLLAVCGAHLSGLALNPRLMELGARLRFRGRTAGGYRLYRLPGAGVPRPALVRTGDGPAGGIAVEVWQLSHHAVGALLASAPAPLGFGPVELDDGAVVTGFVAPPDGVRDALDVSEFGGWRAFLTSPALTSAPAVAVTAVAVPSSSAR
jgi:allophanate hydrolase